MDHHCVCFLAVYPLVVIPWGRGGGGGGVSERVGGGVSV